MAILKLIHRTFPLKFMEDGLSEVSGMDFRPPTKRNPDKFLLLHLLIKPALIRRYGKGARRPRARLKLFTPNGTGTVHSAETGRQVCKPRRADPPNLRRLNVGPRNHCGGVMVYTRREFYVRRLHVGLDRICALVVTSRTPPTPRGNGGSSHAVLNQSPFGSISCPDLLGEAVRQETYMNMRQEAEITTVRECIERCSFYEQIAKTNKNSSTPKVLKTRIKLCLASNAFYSVDEFLAFNWESTR
ncbi:hypothetical protein J6590_032887 [Homalodisca vitripennis]|nr:hypothetical protein J6590_032887 [Homalodisca vitripennis]